jgi:hypothetical protein
MTVVTGERELQDMVEALDHIARLDDLTFRERAWVKAAADFLADLRWRLLDAQHPGAPRLELAAIGRSASWIFGAGAAPWMT